MANPQILLTYPANNDINIPIGERLEIVFDRGLDLSTVKSNIVLYGADYDQTSGPDGAVWIDKDTGDNPYYLKSPGFKGIAEINIELEYVDLSTASSGYTAVDPTVVDGADEVSQNIGHRVIITPREPLAPDIEYTLHIVGNESVTAKGVSGRTVYDLVADPGNASTTGLVILYGGYNGLVADTLNIEITSSGDIGTAKYKYWYTSAGSGSAKTGIVTNRRFRTLIDGVQIRFNGSGFVAGDTWTVEVEPVEYLASNYVINFTTNDGSYSEAPDSPSTPATSQPPDTVIPPAPGSTGTFYVIDSDPLDKSYGNSLKTRTIRIEFSNLLDETTVTQDTVRL